MSEDIQKLLEKFDKLSEEDKNQVLIALLTKANHGIEINALLKLLKISEEDKNSGLVYTRGQLMESF